MRKKLTTFFNLAANALYGRNIRITTPTGVYFLRTTFGHPLKRYLINFEKYDRFLPYLTKAVSKCVIDIGSNVGDTLVLIKSINNTEVVCVEPDKKFISYLKQNIKVNHLSQVKLYPYPISSICRMVSIEKNALKSTSNTNEITENNSRSAIPTKTFHDLLIDLSLDINCVGIIKSDTDGNDWDCLESIADYFDLATTDICYPEFIFYEHQSYLNNLGRKDPGFEKRKQLYKNSLSRLVKHGYTEFYVFDNFGAFIKKTEDLNELFSIVNNSRYFLDVLLSNSSNNHYVEKALLLQSTEKMLIN